MRKNPSLKVPERSQLLESLESANRWGLVFLSVQAALIVGLALLVDWKLAFEDKFITTVAIAVLVGPTAMSILTLFATKKKEIGDLQEQTRFGQFDKHRLRSLFDDTLRRLNLPRTHLPVYLVADKSTNAFALNLGLGIIFRSINGIYFNRQALHKLNADELQDIFGHELGHYYRYKLIADRFLLIPTVLSGLVGIVVVQQIGLDNIVGYIALLACTFVVWYVIGMPRARHSWTIEYLCDDFGAHVHGIAVSIAGLMKLGAEAEVLAWIYQQAKFSKNGSRLSVQEVAEAVEKSIPYGHATREELEAAVQKSIKSRIQQGPSISGFIKYIWQNDEDDDSDNEAEMEKLKKLQNVARIPWESVLPDGKEIQFDEWSLERLVQLIEQYPDQALFRTPDAVELEASHPPLKQRILYLWYNRREIESSAVN